MDRQTETYEMKNYGKQSNFASFLPGIAGVKGIPIWCYYVNRGQCVVSFGVDNKDHAIMEFYPAHMAYQNVKRTGFRTFLRKNGQFAEGFADEERPHAMRIGMNRLEIEEELRDLGLRLQMSYFTLPQERLGALVRSVRITNTGEDACELELLDGMPTVIPYGVGVHDMKNMTQTAKAWMQVEDSETGVPYYRVRASMADSASVSIVEGGNFAFAVTESGERLRVTVDPDAVFAYDNSLAKPVRFIEGGLAAVEAEEEICSNLLPCAFFHRSVRLAAGESTVFYEMIGQVENKELLHRFFDRRPDGAYFEEQSRVAVRIAGELVEAIATKTGDARFDAYCKYTYMDNVLRGGCPMRLGSNKIFYIYSRKHGDLERDYNYFSMLPEFYSQGNGNFRDVNQNRRMDTFFSPFVGRENLHTFYSLIQLDGYNPLGVEKLTYTVSDGKARVVLSDMESERLQELLALVTKPFTPGRLYAALADAVEDAKAQELFDRLIDAADGQVNGNFGEGYWSDHWDYNLDLIEEYLSVFPEREEEMLYEPAYTFFLSQVNVNRRALRYEETANGVRQYHALDEGSRRETEEKLVRTAFGAGDVIKTTLMEKLIILCAAKFATLDAYGMGVEMEGGKPGWYDALNGMPGMLGSSMAETYELARMLDYTIGALGRHPRRICVLEELGAFLEELDRVNQAEAEAIGTEAEVLEFWNRINDAKERYREKTFQGVSGNVTEYEAETLARMLEGWRATVARGIDKALAYGNGICPTYFTYEVTDYEKTADGITPLHFSVQQVPYFLEGPVRYLKLPAEPDVKRALYRNVKGSDLYDTKLSMYRVNASLQNASYELGRARAFTPGWLENASVWLHMEYKYLLELLKSGLYAEFAQDFQKAVIPFLDEQTYGRSVLENSSFIVSSCNPNPKIHGKGFVARLSGSTVEFLNMWKIMMFGQRPFVCEDGELALIFAPVIPEYLIGEELCVHAMFLGGTEVRYDMKERRDYFPGSYQAVIAAIEYRDGSREEPKGAAVRGQTAADVRDGRAAVIEVKLL